MLYIIKTFLYCLFRLEVNDIVIKLETIHFDKDTIEELNKFAKTYKIKVTYCYGYIVEFDKTNVYAISPHKMLFTKYGYNLLVLHYDEYHKNNNLYLIPNEKEAFTIGSMKKYVREYFGMIYKMNCKLNDN